MNQQQDFKMMELVENDDWEIIQKGMDQRQKDLFIDDIVRLNQNNHLIDYSKGGFAEIFAVYIRSEEFKRLDETRKLEILETQFSIYDLFKYIDEFTENWSIGKFS